MKLAELLAELGRRNLTLACQGDELVVRGPKQALDAALRAELTRNKAQLLQALRHGDAVGGIPAGTTVLAPAMVPLVALSQPELDAIAAAVPGGAPNVQDIYPLAPLQQGIFFHYLLARAGDPYLMAQVLAFPDEAGVERYLAALRTVLARHDILRTALAWDGLAEPVQIVLREAALPVERHAFDPAAGDVARQLCDRYDPRHYRLDLTQAPLLRVALARDAAHGRWLLLTLQHHLIGDRTTFAGIQAEIAACLAGAAATLPRALPYREFVAQARAAAQGGEGEAFFREMLAGVAEPTAPFGLIDVRGEGSTVRQDSLLLGDALGARLRAHARRLGVSVASLFHLAWALVLGRASGRDDVVFGTVLLGGVDRMDDGRML
jgi:hypothetical protein